MARRNKGNKANQKPKPQATSTKPRRNRRRRNNKLQKLSGTNKCCLSQIAQSYADTLAHPDTGPLIGIPNADTIFSKKVRVWCRGVTAAGDTNHNVHLLCQPFAALANDISVVSAVPDLTAFPATLATGGVAANAPYASAAFSSSSTGVQGRLVSAVLRARYVGTSLNSGGIHYGLQEPTHNGIQSKTETDILATTCGITRSVKHGEGWFEVTYRPVDHNDTAWVTAIARTDAATYDISSDYTKVSQGIYPFMGIICKLPVKGENIQWEFWAVVEYAGPGVTGKTLTPPDVQGWATVLAAHAQFDEVHSTINTRQATEQQSYVSGAIKSYADQLLSAAAPYLKSGALYAGQALAQHYLRPRQRQRLIQ